MTLTPAELQDMVSKYVDCERTPSRTWVDDSITCAEALHRWGNETLTDAASRVLRRANRLRLTTTRTRVARIVSNAFAKGGDPWPEIARAAQLWREEGGA